METNEEKKELRRKALVVLNTRLKDLGREIDDSLARIKKYNDDNRHRMLTEADEVLRELRELYDEYDDLNINYYLTTMHIRASRDSEALWMPDEEIEASYRTLKQCRADRRHAEKLEKNHPQPQPSAAEEIKKLRRRFTDRITYREEKDR